MKTTFNLTTIALSAIMLFSCQKLLEDILKDTERDRDKEREIKLEADFHTSLTPTDEGEEEEKGCAAPYTFFNNQEGEGVAKKLGSFTTKITFCVDVDPESPTYLEYVDGEGVFAFNNGDELYFTVSRKVLPLEDDPVYGAFFMDPFVFTGGTGRFEGASGEGITDSKVHFQQEGVSRTDHIWTGTLILKKKKKH